MAALAAVLLVLGGRLFFEPGPPAIRSRATQVVLPPGAGVAKIAAVLQRAGVIRSRTVFIVAAELTLAAPRLKAGDYEIRSRSSMADILNLIRIGGVARRFVTVPEGLSAVAVADLLAREGALSGPIAPAREGSILPETYEIRQGETRAAVTRRMQAAQDALLAGLWAKRAPNLPYKTPEEAVILASIVEKETAKAYERPHIAALFINRLRLGMRLETDPTVIYGLTGGTPLGHGLRVSELARRTPYNTYQISGLPPTPICNPGKAALIAALHPDQSGDLYFVADGTGGHVFATSFQAHQRNVARWRAIEHAAPGPKP